VISNVDKRQRSGFDHVSFGCDVRPKRIVTADKPKTADMVQRADKPKTSDMVQRADKSKTADMVQRADKLN
jgi:hypothetical protein